MSPQYSSQRQLYLSSFNDAYNQCTSHRPENRADLQTIIKLLRRKTSEVAGILLSDEVTLDEQDHADSNLR